MEKWALLCTVIVNYFIHAQKHWVNQDFPSQNSPTTQVQRYTTMEAPGPPWLLFSYKYLNPQNAFT